MCAALNGKSVDDAFVTVLKAIYEGAYLHKQPKPATASGVKVGAGGAQEESAFSKCCKSS